MLRRDSIDEDHRSSACADGRNSKHTLYSRKQCGRDYRVINVRADGLYIGGVEGGDCIYASNMYTNEKGKLERRRMLFILIPIFYYERAECFVCWIDDCNGSMGALGVLYGRMVWQWHAATKVVS